MKRNIEALSGSQFDLVVIGGGVNGAATAREAALRGLSVALIDAQDFASGTSSRSSKLIHGGLRYLAQGDLRLVREARLERRLLAQIAPHLARPLPFLLPIYKGDPYSRLKMRAALCVYDWLGNLGREDRHSFYNAQKTLRHMPQLRPESLLGGAVYHDSLTDDSRLTLEYVLDAVEHGAVAVNYAKLLKFALPEQGGAITHAEVADQLTGKRYEVCARFWVNATGPWVDRVRAILPAYDGSKTIRMTKGTHVVLPEISRQLALFAAILPGKRIFVAMPWQGHTLLGTTDTEYVGHPEDVQPERADIEYLLAAVNRVLRNPVGMKDVLVSFAGLRPLVVERGKNPSANTREYRFHRDPWAKNLITVCGGKLTTARALGERLVDVLVAELPGASGHSVAGATHRMVLPGGQICGTFDNFVSCASDAAVRDFGVPRAAADRLVRTYGSRWRQVLEPAKDRKWLAEPLPAESTLIGAEVAFSIREEMAATVEDFLLRRSGLSWMACANPAAAHSVADVFARELAWSAGQRQEAIERFERTISLGPAAAAHAN